MARSFTGKEQLARVLMCVALLTASFGTVAKELVYWSMWNEPEPQAKALRAVMAEYSKTHPDVTFKVVWNGRQNQTKLRSAIQAGIKVDLMDQDGDQLVGGLQKAGGALELTRELDATFKSSLLPGVLDLYAPDGKVYQIPYIYNTVNFWYNREMLKRVGAAAPKTWDDLLTVCGAVKKSGKTALVIEGNQADYNMLYFTHLLERIYGAGGVPRLFNEKSGDAWKQAGVLKAAQMTRDLWDKGCIAKDARGFQYPAGQQTVALGDSMGELVGSWLPAELHDSAGDDFPWGAFNFPAVRDGKGRSTDVQVALLSLVVLKTSTQPKEALDYAKFAVGEKAQAILVKVGQVGVTRKGVPWPANLADAEKSAREATALSALGGGLSIAQPEFAATVFNPEFNKFFLGETSVQQLTETLAAKTRAHWLKQK